MCIYFHPINTYEVPTEALPVNPARIPLGMPARIAPEIPDSIGSEIPPVIFARFSLGID